MKIWSAQIKDWRNKSVWKDVRSREFTSPCRSQSDKMKVLGRKNFGVCGRWNLGRGRSVRTYVLESRKKKVKIWVKRGREVAKGVWKLRNSKHRGKMRFESEKGKLGLCLDLIIDFTERMKCAKKHKF